MKKIVMLLSLTYFFTPCWATDRGCTIISPPYSYDHHNQELENYMAEIHEQIAEEVNAEEVNDDEENKDEPENATLQCLPVNDDEIKLYRYQENRLNGTYLSAYVKNLPLPNLYKKTIHRLKNDLLCYLDLCYATATRDLEHMQMLLMLGINPNLLLIPSSDNQAQSFILADYLINKLSKEQEACGRFILCEVHMFLLSWINNNVTNEKHKQELYEIMAPGAHYSPFLYPLTCAVFSNFAQGTQLLLEYGAEPNIVPHKTPPHALVTDAFTNQNLDIAQLLINYGASLDLLPYQPRTEDLQKED
ncbi:MAG: hypothetical protein H6679_03340 [Epsilonproteobacteria bacterium]|nr:hypothetical protein [Campylobacterota bacterium]